MDLAAIQETVTYIRSFGLLAPLVAFGLFFIQAVFPVFPYIIMASAAGIIFGFWEGFLLSWLGALAGACFAFGIVRLKSWQGFHTWLQKVMKRDVVEVKPFIGFWGIILARIFPVVPTPLINVVAGMSKISFWIFFFSSAIGKVPTALVYSGLGHQLNVSGDIKTFLGLAAAIVIVSYMVVWRLKKRRDCLQGEEAD